MPDILHRLPIVASPARVFAGITDPAGLDAWWTLSCEGAPTLGAQYAFGFGPGYDWAGVVERLAPDRAITWRMTTADDDWRGTRLSFDLLPDGQRTIVDFAHAGWREASAHYRTTSCCWAAYLRLLRRYLEHGERIPYDIRLDV